MSNIYLSIKKLNIVSGDDLSCILNEEDANEYGVRAGSEMLLTWRGLKAPIVVNIDTTDTIVSPGEIGVYEDLWKEYDLDDIDVVKLSFIEPSKAIASIRKKLKGEKLDYEDFFIIMKDIANGTLGEILTTYFASAGYSPGFSYEEMLLMTKALANTGDKLKFDGIVADKHSIGGVAGKGITPIVIPIVATFPEIKVPNTSTRAVTSASATTDMLEVIMPMSFSKLDLEEMMEKNNAFMVWGGGLSLAPADDEIIEVQKPLGMESIDKFVSSIVAKKIAQGVNHVIFDVPVGDSAKISEEEFPIVKETFEKICDEFGIKVHVYKRKVYGIDGFAVGPSLECREFLRVYERHPQRSLQLENDALQMAGKLLELCGVVSVGDGYSLAKERLEDGTAFAKLKSIIEQQGGQSDITSDDLEFGGITYNIVAKEEGKIESINNKKVFQVCKALGNPKIKEAGIYFHKVQGDVFKKGDTIATLYATSNARLNLGLKVWETERVFNILYE